MRIFGYLEHYWEGTIQDRVWAVTGVGVGGQGIGGRQIDCGSPVSLYLFIYCVMAQKRLKTTALTKKIPKVGQGWPLKRKVNQGPISYHY